MCVLFTMIISILDETTTTTEKDIPSEKGEKNSSGSSSTSSADCQGNNENVDGQKLIFNMEPAYFYKTITIASVLFTCTLGVFISNHFAAES